MSWRIGYQSNANLDDPKALEVWETIKFLNTDGESVDFAVRGLQEIQKTNAEKYERLEISDSIEVIGVRKETLIEQRERLMSRKEDLDKERALYERLKKKFEGEETT